MKIWIQRDPDSDIISQKTGFPAVQALQRELTGPFSNRKNLSVLYLLCWGPVPIADKDCGLLVQRVHAVIMVLAILPVLSFSDFQ